MSTLTIPAHYDGHNICLDKPIDLQPDMRLFVTVIKPDEKETEEEFRRDWAQLSQHAFAKFYEREEREHHIEPEYLIKKPNPRKHR